MAVPKTKAKEKPKAKANAVMEAKAKTLDEVKSDMSYLARFGDIYIYYMNYISFTDTFILPIDIQPIIYIYM